MLQCQKRSRDCPGSLQKKIKGSSSAFRENTDALSGMGEVGGMTDTHTQEVIIFSELLVQHSTKQLPGLNKAGECELLRQ